MTQNDEIQKPCQMHGNFVKLTTTKSSCRISRASDKNVIFDSHYMFESRDNLSSETQSIQNGMMSDVAKPRLQFIQDSIR